MGESPVFITGLPRTGKTALRIALGSHPDLSMTRKTRMWTGFHGKFGDLADPDSLDLCLEAMLADPGVARLAPDEGAVRTEFAAGEPTYARLFGVVHAQHARRAGRRRWGEQAALLEGFVDEICSTWPETRVVHLVRDPVSWVIPSAQWRPGAVGSEMGKWVESARRALENRARWVGRYLVVRFEDLASDPEASMGVIGGFLGETFSPRAVDALRGGVAAVASNRLRPVARHHVADLAGPLLGALGYSPIPPEGRLGPARLWFGPLPSG